MLRFRSLGSGSSGNATVVEGKSGHRVTRLLIDCGLGLKQLDSRLEQAGLSASHIDAVFITHEHGDHIGCARQFALRERKPVWMSHGTYEAIGEPDFDGLLRRAQDGVPIDLGELQIMPFTVPHDAREPLQVSCTDGVLRLGLLTDLGHATSHVLSQLTACQAMLLECNHDTDLLALSAYPNFLKQRVGGRYGHLSNQEAADILTGISHPGLEHIVAAHLSLQNNRPDLAQTALSRAAQRQAADIKVADPQLGTDWITLQP